MTRSPLQVTRKKNGFDATSFLTIYLFLFCAIPSFLTIPALGSVGRLSVLWGLCGIVWWILYRAQLSKFIFQGPSRVTIMMLLFLCSLGISYALANFLGLPPSASTTADSSLLRMASWAGVVLVALDGLRDRERLNTLLRRIALAGGLMACLGIAQFLSGQSLVDQITLPGFAVGADANTVQIRGAFTRAAGTASHPLEYGAFLSMSLPISLALILVDHHRGLIRRCFPAIAILMAVMLSVSRSALISVVVGLLLLAPSLPPRIRFKAIAIGSVAAVGVAFAVPGLMGTLRGLFTTIADDSSTVSRTGSIDDAIAIALRNPFFGQGFGSFLPTELILDNQYLLSFIETGIIGLLLLLGLFLTAMLAAWECSRLTNHPAWKVLGPASAAAVGAAAVTLAFFDGLSFPITAGAVFLLVGVCGAMVRIEHTESTQNLKGQELSAPNTKYPHK